MQLTELLFQRVQGLGKQGQVALRPGYVAVVSSQPALRRALQAVLRPGTSDERELPDGSGPARIGLGLAAPSGVTYRLLRELGGERQLQRLEPNPSGGGTRFELLSKDSLEIDSFLRIECGLPPNDQYEGVFVLDARELPSQRAKPVKAGPSIDGERVKALKAELEATKRYEEAQDQLFKVAVKHRELEELLEGLHKAQATLRELESKAAKAAYPRDKKEEIVARIKKLPAAEGKRDEEFRQIARERDRLRDSIDDQVQPFHKSTLFSGGLAAGVVIDVLAVVFKKPSIALAGLVGFGAALVAVLQWIARDEEEGLTGQRLEDLKLREERVKRAFAAEQAPLRDALQRAQMTDPDELLQLFADLADLEAQRNQAAARVKQLLEDPRFLNAEAELQALGAERQSLELAVSTQGFARSVMQIEADMKAALGLTSSGQPKKTPLPENDVPKQLFARAAEVLNTPPEPLGAAVEARLAAYLAALTDKRVVAGRMDANGQLQLSTPDGRWGQYAGLPMPLRDLAYLSLRLALLEKVTLARKAPVIVDDAFAELPPRTRVLLARMLKGIAAQAQVIHRVTEPPPAGVADYVVAIP